MLASLKDAKPQDQAKKQKQLIDLITGEAELRSKRLLIEKFIQNNLFKSSDGTTVEDKFKTYWQLETKKALQELRTTESLQQDMV